MLFHFMILYIKVPNTKSCIPTLGGRFVLLPTTAVCSPKENTNIN